MSSELLVLRGVTGKESGHLWEHLGPWEREEGRARGW